MTVQPGDLSLTEVASHASGGCTCGEHEAHLPELDARAIPHAIRHGAIFGALGAVKPGQAMVLIAPHDPLPLLSQLTAREGDAVAVSYLQRGPDAWRLRLERLR